MLDSTGEGLWYTYEGIWEREEHTYIYMCVTLLGTIHVQKLGATHACVDSIINFLEGPY